MVHVYNYVIYLIILKIIMHPCIIIKDMYDYSNAYRYNAADKINKTYDTQAVSINVIVNRDVQIFM